MTVLGDPRVERTLESLLVQTRPPMEILVDDGGITHTVREIARRMHERDPRVRHVEAPGNISESRNVALAVAQGEFIAFLDADEVAPPDWIDHLLAPFHDESVGFTGGPTPGLPGSLDRVGARFYDGYLRRFYDRVARAHPQALPMGNSAWRSRLFRELGPLDTTLDRRASSEDQEFAVRALGHGWGGRYVPDAWVYHDFRGLGVIALLRKQRSYAKGGYLVWRRHRSTYEASPARVAPYIVLPALLVLGALMVPFSAIRTIGAVLLASGAGGLAGLAIGLTIWGALADSRYPGLRFAVLEIPRRWATLLGAFQGLLQYGWSGRRGGPAGHPQPDLGRPPTSEAGKP